MDVNELRKMISDADNILSELMDCLADESNIHRVYLARQRLRNVHLPSEERMNK